MPKIKNWSREAGGLFRWSNDRSGEMVVVGFNGVDWEVWSVFF